MLHLGESEIGQNEQESAPGTSSTNIEHTENSHDFIHIEDEFEADLPEEEDATNSDEEDCNSQHNILKLIKIFRLHLQIMSAQVPRKTIATFG